MSPSAATIERVVREVLAELGVAPTASIAKPASEGQGLGTSVPSKSPSTSQDTSIHSNGDLRISSRVVTMNDILGRLGSVRRVLIEKKAIVTPAVRDELIRRGISLGESNSCNGQQVSSARLLIVTVGTKFDPTALAAGLARENLKVECASINCVIAAVDQLSTEVACGDSLGTLLTPHTAAALCLANRSQGVRAVTGCDAPSVAAAAAAVGANVLAVDPDRGTFFQLKQIVAEFCRSGVRGCPEAFSKRLA